MKTVQLLIGVATLIALVPEAHAKRHTVQWVRPLDKRAVVIKGGAFGAPRENLAVRLPECRNGHCGADFQVVGKNQAIQSPCRGTLENVALNRLEVFCTDGSVVRFEGIALDRSATPEAIVQPGNVLGTIVPGGSVHISVEKPDKKGDPRFVNPVTIFKNLPSARPSNISLTFTVEETTAPAQKPEGDQVIEPEWDAEKKRADALAALLIEAVQTAEDALHSAKQLLIERYGEPPTTPRPEEKQAIAESVTPDMTFTEEEIAAYSSDSPVGEPEDQDPERAKNEKYTSPKTGPNQLAYFPLPGKPKDHRPNFGRDKFRCAVWKTKEKGKPRVCEKASPNGHEGDDIYTPIGTPVIASGSGVVFSVQRNPHVRGGKNVFISLRDQVAYRGHLHDARILYCHLSKIADWLEPVKHGSGHGVLVEAGDQVAESGNTGIGSSGPHLHVQLEVNIQGVWKKINPWSYLEGAPVVEAAHAASLAQSHHVLAPEASNNNRGSHHHNRHPHNTYTNAH